MVTPGPELGSAGPGRASISLTRELNRSMTLPIDRSEELMLEEQEEVCDAELQVTKFALRSRAQDASKQLLQLMHEARDNLRFWEEKLQSPASLGRVLILQTGAWMFFRHASRWVMRALGYTPPARFDTSAAVQRKLQALRRVNDGLAVALGEIHLQADVLTRMNLADNAIDGLGACSYNMSRAMATLESVQAFGPDPEGEGGDGEGAAEGGEGSMLLLTPTAAKAASGDFLKRTPSSAEILPHAFSQQPYDMKQVWSELQAMHASSMRARRHIAGLLNRYRAPTREEQTWVRRWLRGTALGAAAVYLVAHSRVNGSDDLHRWATQLMHSVRSFFSDHFWEPMQQISKELQRTFAAQEDVDLLALEESKNILQRMLQEFQQRQKGAAGQPAEVSASRAMEQVLKKFEAEARSPIQSLMTGDLSNLMMIQMQAMKVDMESALLQMDRILEANQINFAAMAAMPFFASLWGLAALARRLMLPNTAAAKARARSQKQYARILLVEAERAILLGQTGDGMHPLVLGQQIFCINALYVEALEQARNMSGMEWYNLRADILELAAPRTPVERKLRILIRMSFSYSLFRDA